MGNLLEDGGEGIGRCRFYAFDLGSDVGGLKGVSMAGAGVLTAVVNRLAGLEIFIMRFA